MVTQQDPIAAETEATPAEEVSPPVVEVEDGDAPLIPPDTPVERESPQPEATEEQGPEATEDGAAEVKAEEASEEGSTEAGEESGPTLESLQAELQRERDRRSGLDSTVAELKKASQEAITAAEQRTLAAEQRLQAQQLDVDAARLIQARSQEYLNQGHTEEAAQAFAAREVQLVRAAYEYEQKYLKAEAELEKTRASEQGLSTRQAALEMARLHGVSNDDLDLLMTAPDPERMAAIAKRLGTAHNAETELAKARQAEVPAGGRLDSGGDGGAGPLTDDQKLADMNTPLSEIEEILKRRGEHPFDA